MIFTGKSDFCIKIFQTSGQILEIFKKPQRKNLCSFNIVNVYMIAPRNFEELNGNIVREIENIGQKTLKLVFLNLMKRCRICKANSGGHFQH